MVKGCRRLGDIYRVVKRQDNGARGKGDGVRARRDRREPDEGIIDLAQIAEIRVVQRYIARPQRGEAMPFGVLSQRDLISH